jgi:uncharacterized protein (DUF433 family)
MNANDRSLKIDLRDQPAYTVAEAARYLKLPMATLRSWVVGRPYPKGDGVGQSRPLIHPPKKRPPLLTFRNLIEAHVLRALRTEHGVSIKHVREALKYAEKQENIERLLLRKDLRTNAGKLFLEKYGQLIELSASGQIAMRRIFEDHLNRVEWDDWQFPVRLYPFVSGESAHRPIAIDPGISFGRPILVRTGVSTSVIADRIDAGESVDALAEDYGLSTEEIEQAVLYERTA